MLAAAALFEAIPIPLIAVITDFIAPIAPLNVEVITPKPVDIVDRTILNAVPIPPRLFFTVPRTKLNISKELAMLAPPLTTVPTTFLTVESPSAKNFCTLLKRDCTKLITG